MFILIAIAVFVVVALAVFVIASLMDERSSKARLLRDEVMSRIPAFDNLLRNSPQIAGLQTFLEQADVKSRAGNVLLLCLLSGAGLGLVVLLFSGFPQFAWLGLILGAFLPYAYANYKRTKRFSKFEELFPEAIDTLARAVRAGHAFTTALELIANELAEPVASEFRKLFEEQKFGLPVRDALMNLAERVPLVDVKFFVTAVMLQRETGGNLAEILDNLSYVIRERF